MMHWHSVAVRVVAARGYSRVFKRVVLSASQARAAGRGRDRRLDAQETDFWSKAASVASSLPSGRR